jgi:predicted anti-sigma-YlaC factor YlaD
MERVIIEHSCLQLQTRVLAGMGCLHEFDIKYEQNSDEPLNSCLPGSVSIGGMMVVKRAWPSKAEGVPLSAEVSTASTISSLLIAHKQASSNRHLQVR